MTAPELRAALTALGWSRAGLGRLLRVTERQARRWADGDTPVPERVEAAVVGALRGQRRGFAAAAPTSD